MGWIILLCIGIFIEILWMGFGCRIKWVDELNRYILIYDNFIDNYHPFDGISREFKVHTINLPRWLNIFKANEEV